VLFAPHRDAAFITNTNKDTNKGHCKQTNTMEHGTYSFVFMVYLSLPSVAEMS